MIIGRSRGRDQRGLRKLREAKDFAKLTLLQDAANTDSTGQAILHYEGGTGTNTGSNTAVTFPEFTINHVIPFAVNSSTGVTVTHGNV